MKLIQQNINKQYYCLVDVFYAKMGETSAIKRQQAK